MVMFTFSVSVNKLICKEIFAQLKLLKHLQNRKKTAKINKCNIKDDERLAEEVQKYPCLNGKDNKGYKERDQKGNAWRAVAQELHFEEGNQFFLSDLIMNSLNN